MQPPYYYDFAGFAPAIDEAPSGHLPECRPGAHAFFLDFDGTLVDIAARPDAVTVPDGLRDTLDRLCTATGGATAVVSGRSVEVLSGYLPDFRGPLIGSHGGESLINGTHEAHPLTGAQVVENLHRMANRFAETIPGLLAEDKPAGVVLHFRENEDAEAQAQTFAKALCDCHEEFELHPAKMAYEIRPRGVGKEMAVSRLMGMASFEGRIPVYFGDDRTDEPAFARVRVAEGVSVKVGAGETRAEFRLAAPADVRAALAGWLKEEA